MLRLLTSVSLIWHLFSLQSKIQGGQTLQSRTRRFEEPPSDGPGPGAYNVLPASGNLLRAASANATPARRALNSLVCNLK